jgi:basic membrane lipoprotein Med (substrate-binding protein (PBP1-ABC) superfamily)
MTDNPASAIGVDTDAEKAYESHSGKVLTSALKNIKSSTRELLDI